MEMLQAVCKVPNLDFEKTTENIHEQHKQEVGYSHHTKRCVCEFSLIGSEVKLQLTPRGGLNMYYSRIEELTPVIKRLRALIVTDDGTPPVVNIVKIIHMERPRIEEGTELRILQRLIEAGLVAEK